MKNVNRTTIYIALGTLIIGLLLGWMIFRSDSKVKMDEHQHQAGESQVWTCAMHPQIRQGEPGKCPICGMSLQLLNVEDHPMEVKMSPTAMQLANVQTSIVSRQKPVKEVRMNGKVKADERKVISQVSHIPGRIERLIVNFTGESVRKGQVLGYVYSPELVTAQEELFEAYRLRERQPQIYQAARGKLQNWKLTEVQINSILEKGQIQEQFPVLADVSGIVLRKNVNTGDYVKKGQSLFEVADLTSVWVLFDVYEKDIAWIKRGDMVEFTVQSLPGEQFKGRITFMDPFVNPRTRVVSARVEMNNPAKKLKPDMFAVGTSKSPMDEMKEEIIVPKSAIMWTGERSVVYIKNTTDRGIRFVMNEVVLGPEVGDGFVIREGLTEGQEIATNGTFSIDAAAQLAGKPSMMNPEGGMRSTGHDHGAMTGSGSSKTASVTETTTTKPLNVERKAKQSLDDLYTRYIELKDALVQDDMEKGKSIGKTLLKELKAVDMNSFQGKSHELWMSSYSKSVNALEGMENASNIGDVRQKFRLVSDQFILMAVNFGPFDQALYIQHCPMANDNKGAEWISRDSQILNPYFGESMLGCGSVTKEIK